MHNVGEGAWIGDFNPRPPRGGRLCALCQRCICEIISIHAPREGGDEEDIHTTILVIKFQSTPPARGATASSLGWSYP